MITLDDESILNCPKCSKEYNIEEYEELNKVNAQTYGTYPTYGKPIISIRGKDAPKEALAEIAKRTGGKLYEGHVDIIDKRKYEIDDARICSKCGTEFGIVIILSNKGTTSRLGLVLVTSKDEDK